MASTRMLLALATAAALVPRPSVGQTPVDPPHDVSQLAKATQNPVGDLTAVPFQFNFNTGDGLGARTALTLNFQPAVPFRIGARWNAVARTIVPLSSFPVDDDERESGVGDIQEQLYFTPARLGRVVWGVGPMVSLPTATVGMAETGSWALGPGAVLLVMPGAWVIGGLIQQYWTFADAGDDADVNLFVFQPFVNYNFGQGWALAFAPIMTANWNAGAADTWTVPLGLGLTRTTVFDRRPMSLGAQYYYNVERPGGTASHQLRFVVSLLYPRSQKATP